MIKLRLRGEVIAGALGLTGLCALATQGIIDRAVRDEMRAEAAVGRAIPALLSDPKNAETVAAQSRQQAELTRELVELWAVAEQINRREPLLADVFPDGAQVHRRVRFVELLRIAAGELTRQLQAGAPATPEEIETARQELAEAIAWRDADAGHSQLAPTRTARRGHADRTDRAAWYANVAKARGMRCYVDEGVFDRSGLDGGRAAPSVEELWFAQVELWIQQDVVAAIAEMNDDVAEAHGDGACVEQMPVKRVCGVYVLGYQLRGSLVLPPGQAGSGHRLWELVPVSFTGWSCDADFDVVVFQMVVVMDQRDVLQLIDRVVKRNFYQCTAAACEAVESADAEAGYLYGTEPVMYVELEFEAYMWREIFGPLTPTGVRRMLDRD